MAGLDIHVSVKQLSTGLHLYDIVKTFVHDLEQAGPTIATIYPVLETIYHGASKDVAVLGGDISAFFKTGGGGDKIVDDVKQLVNDAKTTVANEHLGSEITKILATLSDDAGKAFSHAVTDVGQTLAGAGLQPVGATLLGAFGAYEAHRAAGDTPGQALEATITGLLHRPG
jgi:hypothetical protein